jgi:hypothetical protein
MGQVTLSMDGLRHNLTDDIEALGEYLKTLLDELGDYDKEEIIHLFDQVACGMNSFNCVHDIDNESFNILDDLEVTSLGKYED